MKLFANKRLTESIDPYKVTNVKTYSKLLEQEIQGLSKRKAFVDAINSKPQTLVDEVHRALFKITKVAIDSAKAKILTMPDTDSAYPVIVVEIGNKLEDDQGIIQTNVEGQAKFSFGGLKCEAKQKGKRVIVWSELDTMKPSTLDHLL